MGHLYPENAALAFIENILITNKTQKAQRRDFSPGGLRCRKCLVTPSCLTFAFFRLQDICQNEKLFSSHCFY